MLYHVELPEAFLDSVQNVFTATYCCLGAGYVLAGEWMTHNTVVPPKAPYTDALRANSAFLGGTNLLLATNHFLINHHNRKARRMMGIGHALFAAVVAPHHKLLGRMAKVCVAVHSLAAVFWGFVKPKSRTKKRHMEDEPETATPLFKSYRL